MNERIRQLAEQARISFKYKTAPDEMNPGHKLKHLERFAELIVRECVAKLKETQKVELPYLQAVNENAQELPLSVYIAELKEHFGVEE